MRKLVRGEAFEVALFVFAVVISPLRAEGSRSPLEEELNAVRQSIAEGHIGQGMIALRHSVNKWTHRKIPRVTGQ